MKIPDFSLQGQRDLDLSPAEMGAALAFVRSRPSDDAVVLAAVSVILAQRRGEFHQLLDALAESVDSHRGDSR